MKHDFGASLHAAFTVHEVRAQLQDAGLALDVEALSDRHLIVTGVLHELTPTPFPNPSREGERI